MAKNEHTDSSDGKKGKGARIFLIIASVIILLGICGIMVVRFKYNNEFLRQMLVQKIAESTLQNCQIESVDLSVLGGSAAIRNLRLLPKTTVAETRSQFLEIKNIEVKIALWRSLLSRAVHLQALVDGLNLTITRDPRSGSEYDAKKTVKVTIENVNEIKQTTNIRESLDQIRGLPWEEWLSNLDILALAQNVVVNIKNGKVSLRDNIGILGDCQLNIEEITATKKNSDLNANVKLSLITPQTPTGGNFLLKCTAQITPHANMFDRLTMINLSGEFVDFDLPYISRYYNLGFHWRKNYFTLGAPLSGNFAVNSVKIDEGITANYQISTARLIEIFPVATDLEMPGLSSQGEFSGKLTGEWQVKNFVLTILNSGAAWVRVNGTGKGNLDQNIDAQISVYKNLGIFSQSELARRLKLAGLLRGETQLKITAQTNERASITANLQTQNLAVMVDNQLQDFPVSGEIAVKFTPSEKTIKDLEIEAEFASQIANLQTVTPLKMPEPTAWQQLRGQMRFTANLAEITKRFHAFFEEIGIGKIEEQISGILSCNEDKYQMQLTVTNVGGKYAPLSLNAQIISPTAPIVTLIGDLKFNDKENIQWQGKITRQAARTQGEINAQLAVVLPTVSALYQRLAPIFNGKPLPPLKGTLRARVDGQIEQTGATTQVTTKFVSLLENAETQYDDFVWREKKAQAEGNVAMTVTATEQNATINDLKIRSSSTNLNLQTGAMQLHLLNKGLPVFLDNLPKVELVMNIGENAWRQIDYLFKDLFPRAWIDFSSILMIRANYAPDKKTFWLPELSIKTNDKATAVLKEFSLTTAITNLPQLAQLAESPQTLNPAVILASIPQGVQIPKMVLTVAGLKRALGEEGNASVRALRGQDIVVQGVQLKPQADGLALSGMANSNLIFLGAAQQVPLMQLAGNAGFTNQKPLLIKINEQAIAVNGILDMTNAAVRFSALDPYIYDKPQGKPLQFSFSATQHLNGSAEVASAELNGQLPIKLNKFSVKSDEQNLQVKLDSVQLGAPFNLVVKNVNLDRAADILRAEVEVGTIDLAALRAFMPSFQNLSWTGSLQGARAKIDSKYAALLGKKMEVDKANGALTVGKFSLNVTNTQNQANIVTSFDGANFDTRTSTFSLRNFSLTNPTFSAVPVVTIPLLSVQPQLATLNNSPFVITQILIDGLRAIYEKTKDRGTNVEAVQKVLDGLSTNSSVTSAATPTTSAAPAPDVAQSSRGGNAVLISTLKITNGKVSVRAPGQFGDGMELPLNVEVHDITENSTGSLVSQIIKSMMGTIIGQSIKSILSAPQLRELVNEQIIGNLGKIADIQIGNLKPLDLPAGILKNVGEAGGEGVGKIGNVVGGVMKGIFDTDKKDNASAPEPAKNAESKNAGRGVFDLLNKNKK